MEKIVIETIISMRVNHELSSPHPNPLPKGEGEILSVFFELFSILCFILSEN
jgi:hypothetical protein